MLLIPLPSPATCHKTRIVLSHHILVGILTNNLRYENCPEKKVSPKPINRQGAVYVIPFYHFSQEGQSGRKYRSNMFVVMALWVKLIWYLYGAEGGCLLILTITSCIIDITQAFRGCKYHSNVVRLRHISWKERMVLFLWWG